MFLVSVMDDVEDTSVGSTGEPPMIKLAYFLWKQHNLYVIELISTYLLLLALYSLSVSKRSMHYLLEHYGWAGGLNGLFNSHLTSTFNAQ